MSQHYFDDDYEKFQILQARANAWVGTPYQHGGKTIGLGIDCVHFVENLCYEIGIITQITQIVDYGYYPPTWYLTRENAIVEAIDYYLANYLNPAMTYQMSETDLSNRAGDLLCLQIKSPVINHVAIKLLGNEIVHANTRAKRVVKESVEGYLKYLRRVYSFWRAE